MEYRRLANLIQLERDLDTWERSLTSTSCSSTSEVPSNPSDDSTSSSQPRTCAGLRDAPAEKLHGGALPEDPVPTLSVAGVPGGMSQAALIELFAGLGVQVRQAWLEKSKCAPTPLDRHGFHQGSGFLFLHDHHSMEQIMGFENSRFLDLPGGVRLELKRVEETAELLSSHSAPKCPAVKEKQAPDPEVWRASVALGLRQGLAMPAAVEAASRALLPKSRALGAAGGDKGLHRRGGKNRRKQRLGTMPFHTEQPAAPAQWREETERKASATRQLQDSILWL